MTDTHRQSPFDVVAIAASAGGLHALHVVVGALPAGFPAAVLVVQHLLRDRPSQLADLLNKHAAVHVKEVEQGEPLKLGMVYIAQPDRHFEVAAPGIARLTQSPAMHYARPSAELLFESVASLYQCHAIAVVLTGNGKDGSAGVGAIKLHGGIVIVQDPADAEYSGMPNAAIDTGCADFILPLGKIADQLIQLVMPDKHPDP
jgi:two-component system chemotaxis response regulator CheB